MGLEFYEFKTVYSIARKDDVDIRRMTPLGYYESLIKYILLPSTRISKDQKMRDLLCGLQELDAYNWNRPYYKVCPSLINELAELKLEIPASYVKFPYPTMEIRFYKDNPIRVGELEPKVVLISFLPVGKTRIGQTDLPFNEEGVEDWLLLQGQYQNYQGEGAESITYVPLYKDRTLEENIVNLREYWNKIAKVPDDEVIAKMAEKLLRIAIGVSFFSMDNHELIMPDLTRRVIERMGSKSPEEQKAKIQSELAKRPGWRVGKEIQLPRPIIVDLDPTKATPSSGRELQYGHLRAGHLRLQRYGAEGDFRYETIFIAPTMVRPDLPTKFNPGYRITK